MKLLKSDFQIDLSDTAESEFRRAAAKEIPDAERRAAGSETFSPSESGGKGETFALKRHARRENFEARLLNVAVAAGFPPHVRASRFFIDAVKAVVLLPSRVRNTRKSLYRAVARQNFTSVRRVKRELERAAKASSGKGKTESLNRALGADVFRAEDRPTAIELIAAAADVLTKEYGDLLPPFSAFSIFDKRKF